MGAVSGYVGAAISSAFVGVPTGPVIVLVSSAVLIVSLLFSPARGLLWARLRDRRMVRRILSENLLKDLYVTGERSGAAGEPDRGSPWLRPVPWGTLMGMRGQGRPQLGRVARRLRQQGLVRVAEPGPGLTADGVHAASAIVRKHRLWELYLTRQLELAADHVHRDADAMEHTLSDEAVAILDEKLGFPATDPHGREIPRPASRRQRLEESAA